jgi:hypothetical protein
VTEQKDELLASRYGKKSGNSRAFRVFAYLGVALLAIGAVTLGLANWSPIQSTTIGFRVVSSWQTEVDFEIQMPPGQVAECTLEALNNSFAVVGHIKRSYGPFDQLISRHTVSINTYEEAVTGLVDNCSLR